MINTDFFKEHASFFNQHASVFGTTAVILTVISIIIFYYESTKLGKRDERSRMILTAVYRQMFLILSLSMVVFYIFVPKVLVSIHCWFPVFFSLSFIWCPIYLKLKLKTN